MPPQRLSNVDAVVVSANSTAPPMQLSDGYKGVRLLEPANSTAPPIQLSDGYKVVRLLEPIPANSTAPPMQLSDGYKGVRLLEPITANYARTLILESGHFQTFRGVGDV